MVNDKQSRTQRYRKEPITLLVLVFGITILPYPIIAPLEREITACKKLVLGVNQMREDITGILQEQSIMSVRTANNKRPLGSPWVWNSNP